MNYKPVIKYFVTLCTAFIAVAQAADKPNILFIVSDDTGYGDVGPYGGGEGRGMPTPNFDKLSAAGMTFFSFYAQPSCPVSRFVRIVVGDLVPQMLKQSWHGFTEKDAPAQWLAFFLSVATAITRAFTSR